MDRWIKAKLSKDSNVIGPGFNTMTPIVGISLWLRELTNNFTIAFLNQVLMMKPRVAFILYRYPLGVSSMIVNSIRLFADRGYLVDIFININSLNLAPIEFNNDSVRKVVYDDSQRSLPLKAYIHLLFRMDRFATKLLAPLPDSLRLPFLFPDLYLFSIWLRRRLKLYTYEYYIPVECRSLLCFVDFPEESKIIYYNMELLDWNKYSPLYPGKTVLKEIEYKVISRLDHVAITSKRRAEMFCEINKFPMNKIDILPVTPLGDPIRIRSGYFRKVFGIPEDTRVVIYCGSFFPWAKCLEIIRTVKHWPDDYALVMHTWNQSAVGTEYYNQMVEEARGLPIYFSFKYIEYDKLALAISSADIGLMFYDGSDANYSELLFSSNKLGEYLKAGLMIICSDLPSLKQFVEDNDIGVAIPVEELPRAIKETTKRLGAFKANSVQCYSEKFRFDEYFSRFYERLQRWQVESKEPYHGGQPAFDP